MEENVLEAYNIAKSIYRNCKKENHNDEKIKNLIKEALRKHNSLNDQTYIFIDSIKGSIVLSPLLPTIERKNIWNENDEKEISVFKKFLTVVLYSPKNQGTVWTSERIYFVKLFKPYNWIVGGTSSQNLKEYIKECFKKHIKEHSSFNLFVVDLNDNKKDTVLSTNFLPRLKQVDKEKLRKGIFFNDKDRIYYVRLFPQWNLVVGSYVKKIDITKEIISLKEELLRKIKKGVLFAILVLLIILTISMVVILFLLKKLNFSLEEVLKKNRLLQRARRTLIIKVYKDELTKLSNRRKLEEDIRKIDPSKKVYFALINIRNFKELNELFGLTKGDEILSLFAKNLKKIVKKESKETNVYRIRGDRFGVLTCSKSLSDEFFIGFIKNLIKSLEEETFEIEGLKFKLDVTAGISTNKDNLIIKAEIAEQEAKKRNMNLYVFDKELQKIYQDLHKNIIVASKLKEAIKNDRIVPFFQPIVNLKTGEVEKYEVLMRVFDEEGKLLSPNEFLPIAKKTGIYLKLSKRLMEKALEIAKKRNIKISMNISSEDLASTEMKNWLLERVKNSGIAANICFEIVETEAFNSLEILKEFYSKIKELNAELSIDDFGSGYSNFEYISTIKPDYIKIDGSLIKKIPDSKEVEILTKHIVLFCKELNIKTIAEFVSSEEILRKVEELGIDYGQGFYLGKPTQLD
ncbi:sensor domain-containing phosphodiesterase [Desulfurobacterium thermolithotrophum]|uniref:sensor domain-containing phosphodiesterase n=1 Tax=Desulfurobacterium thermolithotrophum TaxID=64160 RepID=UPI003082EFB0